MILTDLGCGHSNNNSDHQEYHVFSRGSQPKPSFATGILGGGPQDTSEAHDGKKHPRKQFKFLT